MRHLRRSTTMIAAISAILACTGCLKRHEIIQVRRDKSVAIELDYSGPEDSFEGPDAMPSPKDGWNVRRSVRMQGDDEQHALTASATFAPGAPLPETFGDNEDVYLTFPTRIEQIDRADGVYLRFRRLYVPRRYAVTQFWNEYFINDDIKVLSEKDSATLTQAERVQLIRAFADVESHQQLEVIRLAVDDVLPDTTPEAWMAARRAMLNVYDNFDVEGLAESTRHLSSDAAGETIVKAGEAVPQNAEDAFVETLSARMNLTRDDVHRLRSTILREALRRRVTESTRSHSFKIELTLPGEIVGHNGNAIEDGRIVWEFDGRAFCDRPFELIATSRLDAAH